jgi:hypothetical protein
MGLELAAQPLRIAVSHIRSGQIVKLLTVLASLM